VRVLGSAWDTLDQVDFVFIPQSVSGAGVVEVKDEKAENGCENACKDTGRQEEIARFRKHFWQSVSCDALYTGFKGKEERKFDTFPKFMKFFRSKFKTRKAVNPRISEKGSIDHVDRKSSIFCRFYTSKLKTIKAKTRRISGKESEKKVEDTTKSPSIVDSCDSSDRSSLAPEWIG